MAVTTRCPGHHKDGLPGHCALCGEPRSTTCDRPLRDGPCALDRDHRGWCSTVAFTCDGCGKRRRGSPHKTDVARLPDGEVEATYEWCFMCSVVAYGEVDCYPEEALL